MLTDAHVRKLSSINSIEKLLAFLRDDLNWPINEGDKEEVLFTFSADELGLKEEHFPKINALYQIRPITRDQPWGIFFIDFENKKLPITLMRRILNHLRVKNRGLSGQWDAGDLLFMTTYGEEVEGMREVAFAHFHQQEGDLPTLNVLQWDAQDAPAKLQTTYDTLRGNLGWPPDTSDKEAWRQQWRQPFKHRIGHVITTAKALAEKLAELSRDIRDRVSVVLEAETEKGPMTKLFAAFKQALIHDLKPADFADTFAQTITYGLFSAAVSRRYPEEKGSKSLTTETIAEIVPETNPFLREVLATFLDVGGRKKGGIDFDELGVQDVVELLRSDETDMRAILEDFGNRKQGEDPVIHFYEDYLKAYNKELKVKRGVFYTPQPVVSYIVRSVHELLQTEFGLEDGLASTSTWGEMAAKNPELKIPEGTPSDSPFVVILDPATGTATFLVEVIDVIHKHLLKKWSQNRAGCIGLLRLGANGQQPTSFDEFWNAYVPDHLLPRLYGYELMMAPYAIAHMKVGLKLGETGYRFGSSQRVRIYLTNALEPASELQARLALDWEALAHEAMAVKAVKETQRFTVVIGNPPYSGLSANLTPTARAIVDRYRYVDNDRIREKGALQFEKNLQDDYVKFYAWSEETSTSSGVGILALICNNGFLETPTLRGMRSSLIRSFNRMYFVDLHGSTKRPLPGDENVFDIQQGVAISILANARADNSASIIGRADIFGGRPEKYAFLQGRSIKSTSFQLVTPLPPMYSTLNLDSDLQRAYNDFPQITAIMPLYSSGTETGFDELLVAFNREELWNNLDRFLDATKSDQQVTDEFSIDGGTAGKLLDMREGLRADFNQNRDSYTVVGMYRVFDSRAYYYKRELFKTNSFKVMRNLIGAQNMALVAFRQQSQDGFQHAFATSQLGDKNAVSLRTREINYYFPLHVLAEGDLLGLRASHPNLSLAFLDALANSIGRRFESGGSSPGPGGLFAESGGVGPPGAGAISLGGETIPASGGTTEARGGTTDSGEGAPDAGGGTTDRGRGTPDASAGDAFSPEDVFHYIYAVLHSPAYRSRYAEFLKIDFPRIPLPGGPEIFDALVPLGAELVALHLIESRRLDTPMTTFIRAGAPRVEKVSYSENTVWIDKPQTVGFRGVPEAVWNFHIGGYQVCEKWLKDRGPKKGKEGRILSPEDIAHYHKIVVALSETIRIMREIDMVIDAHGGWPGAFQGGEQGGSKEGA